MSGDEHVSDREVAKPVAVERAYDGAENPGLGFEDVESTIASSPQLSFDTIFDEPSTTLEVPCVLDCGARAEVKVVDRFTRGVAIVGRFALEPSLLGLKVTPGKGSVRVRLQLSVDTTTDSWWDKRTPKDTTRGEDATARLFFLRSQGRTRAAIGLAAADMTPDGSVRAQIEFDLEPDAVSADGLLVLEATQPTNLPDWAESRIMPYAPVGVRVDKVWLSDAVPEAPAAVRPFVINQRDLTRHQILTLHPTADGAAGTVRIRRHYHRPVALVSRAGRKVLRESRARVLRQPDPAPAMDEVVGGWVADDELEVVAVEAETGAPVEVEVRPSVGDRSSEHGFLQFHVPNPPTGPVLVGVRHRDPEVAQRPALRRRLITWEVTGDWR